MRLCIGCKHCAPKYEPPNLPGFVFRERCCNETVLRAWSISPVDGSPRNPDPTALQMRTEGPCGWDAKYWEKPIK